MNNRCAAILAILFALQGTVALGQGVEAAILAQLRSEGYAQISVNTTILGRTRIVAKGQHGQREIVLNPRTGEVLRDVWFVADTARGSDNRSKGGGRGSSSGRDDDRDDDRDDNRDDDDDDGGKGRGRGRGGDD